MNWRPIETAPKNPDKYGWGPRILVATTHHRIPIVVIARYSAGIHKCWLDICESSSVSARTGDGSMWAPLPEPPDLNGHQREGQMKPDGDG